MSRRMTRLYDPYLPPFREPISQFGREESIADKSDLWDVWDLFGTAVWAKYGTCGGGRDEVVAVDCLTWVEGLRGGENGWWWWADE